MPLANLSDVIQAVRMRFRKMKSLNRLKRVRKLAVGMKKFWLRRVWDMDIDPTAELSLRAKLDMTFPKGIHIGARSYVAFDVRIMTHDMTRNLRLHTRIGENCFVGGGSIILPGVEVGSHSIVGAGSIVTKSVPPGSVVAGNPAKIISSHPYLLSYGRFPSAGIDPSLAPRQPQNRGYGQAAAAHNGLPPEPRVSRP